MLPADIPDDAQLIDLIDHRAVPSVTITLESSPLPQDHERVRIALRDAVDDAVDRIEQRGDLPHGAARAVEDRLTALLQDDGFWAHQSRSLVVFASPDRLHAFRLADRIGDKVAVGDRFDTSRLLRTIAYPWRIFVLQLSEHLARLTEIGPDHGPVEHPLDLPEDHQLMLHHADNDGDADRARARGATGDRLERTRFCRTVQDEVVGIVPPHVPLLLAAATELAPAYRAVNTHPELLENGVDAHPASLDDREIERLAREALDRLSEDETAAWKEDFGTLRAQRLATTQLNEVAAAAASAAVDELRFDLESDVTGRLDEFGRIVDRDAPDAPPLVDEIVARVLRTGGRVRAVRNSDLLDGSPLAATLRFEVPMPQ